MILAGCALVFFSLLAFWKWHVALFMITAGISIMLGLEWYDVYRTSLGLTISLMLIAYSLVCLGFAFKLIFWKEYKIDDGD